MPTDTCRGCGRITNSATSDYWLNKTSEGKPKEFGVATECYAAFVDGVWVEGCKYDAKNPYHPHKMIGFRPAVRQLPPEAEGAPDEN